jgi:hypothetical protein
MPDVFVSNENKSIPEEKTLLSSKIPLEKSIPLLASFCHNPTGVTFINQEHDEKIILFLRKHFIKNISWISMGFLFLLLPIILIFPVNFIESVQSVIPLRFILVFLGFYYLIIVGFVYTSFITWFYNVGIITTKQIIDVDFTDIMYREVAKVRIEDVIDAEYIQGGFLHSFFDYGNVFVQTEGLKPNFEFHSIPYPDKTTDIIIDLKAGKND